MGTLQHPDYATLPIIVGGTAQAGAFYVTVKNKMLSHIALDAYGSGTLMPVLLINKSKYNQQHCIYRVMSTNCSSGKVPGSLAGAQKSWAPGAWLSLCNVDRAGADGYGTLLHTAYQIIWIPTADGKEPNDLETPVTEPKTPKNTIPGFHVETPEINVKIPDIHIGGDTPAPTPGPETPVEEPKKAGVPWWLGALLGGSALITVIVFAVRDKKKGKKRAKKSKGNK